MSLDKATVARIATLARIKVADADLDRMAGELQTIMSWIEQLNEVDTKGVEPMTSAVEVTLPQREDVVNDGGYADRILANAREPVMQGEGGFFTVPKVVE
ncbi:MAG TPA: Asp-tRNA(Asn)/Glu-tRNA(Gln) amidotransferase subunit GatC [Alphaproteobacteria bacterium]|nr:Asp-tRNA(Asn)/Glu-tRNA(Gln) amidotransferase subunit GatC [Alphaproteobacteria bacterium]